MKKLIVATLIALPLAFSARAQWIVYDPTMNVQQILNEAESIAKYVTMIDNQVQQLSTLTSQLNEFKNYESLFGNPSQVLLSMVAPLDADLKNLEPNLNLENLVADADGVDQHLHGACRRDHLLAAHAAPVVHPIGDDQQHALVAARMAHFVKAHVDRIVERRMSQGMEKFQMIPWT